MTTAATPPAAPAPNAATPAVDPDDVPLPPLDRDAEIKDQIARAQEVTAREARKKEKAEKKAAGKKPEAAKAPPKESTPEEIEAGKKKLAELDKGEPEEKPEPVPDANARTLVRARQLADEGNLDEAFKLAFGKPAAAFNVNSKRWAEWRSANTQARREAEKQRSQVIEAARELEQRYGSMVQAKKAYDAEDYEEALRLAFGDELNSFQKKALARFHGKNPEVEAMRRELRERDERDKRAQEEYAQRQQAAEEQRAHEENERYVHSQLTNSTDPEVAELSKRPRFVKRVYQVMLQNYDRSANITLSAAEAAEMVRDEIVEEFGPVFGRNRSESASPHQGGETPESPHRAGIKPARQGAATAAPTTLSQRGAQEASSPGRALTDAELFKKYEQLAKASNG